jgi:hypothetical protein
MMGDDDDVKDWIGDGGDDDDPLCAAAVTEPALGDCTSLASFKIGECPRTCGLLG